MSIEKYRTSMPIEVLHSWAEEAQVELTQLRAEVERLKKDAERYRYLRHISRRECLAKNGPEAGCWIDCEDENHTLILLTEEDADAAIDAAIAKEKEHG